MNDMGSEFAEAVESGLLVLKFQVRLHADEADHAPLQKANRLEGSSQRGSCGTLSGY